MKANNVSEKGMPDGKTYKVNVYEPTFTEWCNHFHQPEGESPYADDANKALERFASDYNGHKVANNLASALKGAFKRVMDVANEKSFGDGDEGKTVKSPEWMEKALELLYAKTARSSAEEKALALVERVKGGDVFDLREFVSAKKREKQEKRVPLVQFNAVKLVILTKWLEGTMEWRQALIDKLELPCDIGESVNGAIEALEARYCAPPLVDLASLLGE